MLAGWLSVQPFKLAPPLCGASSLGELRARLLVMGFDPLVYSPLDEINHSLPRTLKAAGLGFSSNLKRPLPCPWRDALHDVVANAPVFRWPTMRFNCGLWDLIHWRVTGA